MIARENIDVPALGCKIGHAYQIMLSQLASALKEAQLDITTSEYLVLRAVYRKDGLQQCDIAEMVGKDKAAVCRCVSSLEKKGLLKTEIVSHKCLKVYLTDRSKKMEVHILNVASKRHQSLMDIISPEELDVLTVILDKIIKTE